MLQESAPKALLDSYGTERHTVGECMLMHTQAKSALLASGADVTALRQLFAELSDRTENVHMIAATMVGADVRYDMSEENPAEPTGWFVLPLDLTPASRFANTKAEC